MSSANIKRRAVRRTYAPPHNWRERLMAEREWDARVTEGRREWESWDGRLNIDWPVLPEPAGAIKQ